jgi:hypothetical protein
LHSRLYLGIVLIMPVKLNIDWAHALNLYNQGLKVPRIAEILGVKVNTISARAKRHNWAHNRDKAVQAVASVVQNMISTRPKTVQERAESWVDRTVGDIERTVSGLEKLPVPQNIDGWRKHEEVWGMHVKRGRSTFGLDQQGTNVQINIGCRSTMSPVEPVPIDITPTPEQ